MTALTSSLQFARTQSLARRLFKLEAAFLRRYRLGIFAALVAMLGQSLLLLPLPWLQGWIIDKLAEASGDQLGRTSSSAIILLAGVIPLACLLARTALSWLSSRYMNRVSLEFVQALTDALHRKLQRLPLSYFDRRETGELMARLTSDVGTLLIFLSASSLQLVADLVLAAGILVGLLLLSWPLALVSFLALPLFFWNHRRFSDRIWKLSRGVQERSAALYALVSERLSAIRTVRALGTESREVAEFSSRLDEHTDECQRNLRATAAQSLTAVLISGLATVGLVCLAALLLQRGLLSLGQAAAFLAYLGLLYQPLVRLTQFYGGISATFAAVDRITEVLAEPEPLEPRKRRLRGRVRGNLRLRDVSFAYGAGPLVLDRINVRIEPGMTVGILGESGSGKSTLLALLPRLYDLPPGGGRILLDGRDIRSIRAGDLRRAVMLVPQQARLFEGTLRFNLTYAAPNAGDRLIRRALEAVDLAGLIAELPQGLSTWVGERGASLSGGQRQRVALARALIARPPVLLLDDCTSALDSQTEARVRQRMADFRCDQARVVVSHKWEALREADWLVVLKKGRILQQGDPRRILADGLEFLNGPPTLPTSAF